MTTSKKAQPQTAKRPKASEPAKAATTEVDAAYLRPEGEDDDGYDPWSDRPAAREPLFEADPWA